MAALEEGEKASPLTGTRQKPSPPGFLPCCKTERRRKGRKRLACEGGRLGCLHPLLSAKPGDMSEWVRGLSVPKETLLATDTRFPRDLPGTPFLCVDTRDSSTTSPYVYLPSSPWNKGACSVEISLSTDDSDPTPAQPCLPPRPPHQLLLLTAHEFIHQDPGVVLEIWCLLPAGWFLLSCRVSSVGLLTLQSDVFKTTTLLSIPDISFYNSHLE